MKKRALSLVLSVALMMSLLTGCSTKANETSGGDNSGNTSGEVTTAAEATEGASQGGTQEAGEAKKVTGLFFTLEGEFFTFFDSMLKENCTTYGLEYKSQSSNGDALTMIQQIENEVASGTDLLFVWASSGPEVADALTKARESGVKVVAFVQDPGENARDVFRGSDETMCGETIAELAKEWADKQYGADAAAGTIKTEIFCNTDSAEQKERFEAIQATLKEDARFTILEAAGIEASTVKAQEATENMFIKYGEVDCILTTGGEMVLGSIAYVLSDGSPVKDPTQLGLFGTEMNSELASYMKDGILKGSVLNGGNPADNVKEIAAIIDKLLKGEAVDCFSPVDMGKLTIDTLANYGF